MNAFKELGVLLKECGAQRPECGQYHSLIRLGFYPNGDAIRRPICDGCLPHAEAKGVVPHGSGAL